MNPAHDRERHLPATVSAHLEARLAPFSASPPASAGTERRVRLGLLKDLKLLFAALGAGNSVVPLGDNGHATRMLSEYAHRLRSMN